MSLTDQPTTINLTTSSSMYPDTELDINTNQNNLCPVYGNIPNIFEINVFTLENYGDTGAVGRYVGRYLWYQLLYAHWLFY